MYFLHSYLCSTCKSIPCIGNMAFSRTEATDLPAIVWRYVNSCIFYNQLIHYSLTDWNWENLTCIKIHDEKWCCRWTLRLLTPHPVHFLLENRQLTALMTQFMLAIIQISRSKSGPGLWKTTLACLALNLLKNYWNLCVFLMYLTGYAISYLMGGVTGSKVLENKR